MSGLFERSFRSLDRPELPGYELGEIIGRGGHSTVYEGRDAEERAVAIKRWHDPELGAVEGARIRREARVLARLHHPGLARYHDLVDDASGRACLIMELIAGRSLAAILEAGPLPSAGQTLAWAQELAKVLAYLLQEGVVHRDIKPANVLVRPDGALVLVDFSIVKLTDGPRKARSGTAPTALATAAESSLGTAPYMAPEQCAGDLGLAIDHRTDLYGFGALIFHLITGHPPWDRESAWERLERNPWHSPYPSRPKIRAAVQAAQSKALPELAQLTAACLQGRPERRPRDARQLAARLSPRRARRGLPAALFLGLVGLAIFLGLFYDRAPLAVPNPERTQKRNSEVEDMLDLKKTLGAALVAPLMTLAAGSTAEAELYEDAVTRVCERCERAYPAAVERCPGDKAATLRRLEKVVRAPQAYFPIEASRRWRYRGSNAARRSLRMSEGRLLISGLAGASGERSLKPRLAPGGLEVDGARSVPFPIKAGMRWETAEPPGFIAPAAPGRRFRMGLLGFTRLPGVDEPCLTLSARWDDLAGPGRALLYFAPKRGLVRMVSRARETEVWELEEPRGFRLSIGPRDFGPYPAAIVDLERGALHTAPEPQRGPLSGELWVEPRDPEISVLRGEFESYDLTRGDARMAIASTQDFEAIYGLKGDEDWGLKRIPKGRISKGLVFLVRSGSGKLFKLRIDAFSRDPKNINAATMELSCEELSEPEAPVSKRARDKALAWFTLLRDGRVEEARKLCGEPFVLAEFEEVLFRPSKISEIASYSGQRLSQFLRIVVNRGELKTYVDRVLGPEPRAGDLRVEWLSAQRLDSLFEKGSRLRTRLPEGAARVQLPAQENGKSVVFLVEPGGEIAVMFEVENKN